MLLFCWILLRAALQSCCNRWSRSCISISHRKCPVGFGVCEKLLFTPPAAQVYNAELLLISVQRMWRVLGWTFMCASSSDIEQKLCGKADSLFFCCIDQFFLLHSASWSLVLQPPLQLTLSSWIFCPNLHLFLLWETGVMLFWGVGKFNIHHKTCLCGITNVVASRFTVVKLRVVLIFLHLCVRMSLFQHVKLTFCCVRVINNQ